MNPVANISGKYFRMFTFFRMVFGIKRRSGRPPVYSIFSISRSLSDMYSLNVLSVKKRIGSCSGFPMKGNLPCSNLCRYFQ